MMTHAWPTVESQACRVIALMTSAHSVIDDAFKAGAEIMAPMFSGGHDSLCAVYAASAHPRFDGNVYAA